MQKIIYFNPKIIELIFLTKKTIQKKIFFAQIMAKNAHFIQLLG
jgi:hypothetical protein